MIYHATGVMSGSSLDGLDIVYAEFSEKGNKWAYEIKAAECYEYDEVWRKKLEGALKLSAYDYLLLHSDYGKLIGRRVNEFIDTNQLHHKVQLISSHGHTIFHAPHSGMTAQLGNGAAIAAETGINTVCDLRTLDVAFGGEGAPIVPVGEKLMWGEFDFFLNIGGIANISWRVNNDFVAFDVCPANRVLNLLAMKMGKAFDENGKTAKSGDVNAGLLDSLNRLGYYSRNYPKSLANNFGTDVIFPLIESFRLSTADALRTCVEHITLQVANAVAQAPRTGETSKLFITGGGAFNEFLVERLGDELKSLGMEIVIPDENTVKYKEALVMALLGILRWREENTVMYNATGARRSSIGGAVWIGQEA